MGGQIFISYRREDTRADAGRLYDRLFARYAGKVFRDVASLEPGVDWRVAIGQVIGRSDACIAVIGPRWISTMDANGRPRLYDPDDMVRRELAAALQRPIRVFPILVGGATMPDESMLPPDLRPLSGRQSLSLSEQSWDDDFGKLVKALERSRAIRSRRPVLHWVLGGFAAVVLWIIIEAAAISRKHDPVPTVPTAAERIAPSAERVPPGAFAQAGAPAVNPWGRWTATLRDERGEVELYPNSSFRWRWSDGSADGRWSYNKVQNMIQLNGIYADDHSAFRCDLSYLEDPLSRFAGNCVDREATWPVALTRP